MTLQAHPEGGLLQDVYSSGSEYTCSEISCSSRVSNPYIAGAGRMQLELLNSGVGGTGLNPKVVRDPKSA